MSFVLACDLGGSSLRAGLVDRQGAIIASHSVFSQRIAGEGGASEADPVLWWQDFVAAVEALAATVPDAFAEVAAISITAITRTQVLLDGQGRVLRPAILWNDTRAESSIDALREQYPPDHPEIVNLNAFHPLARLWWLHQAEPDVARSVAAVIEPKDYLNHCLTGVIASDHVSMARLSASAQPGADGSSLFGAVQIDYQVLPRLLEPGAVAGSVLDGLGGALSKLAGLPVICMANDTWATVVGLGAMRSDHAYNISGTTEVLGIVAGESARAEGLLTVAWGDGLTQIGGPSQSGADSLVWLLDLLGQPRAEGAVSALSTLLAGTRHAESVIFLPYLSGERVPHWDPSLRGALLGLNRQHRGVDLAFAVMEGVGYLNRLVLDRAETAIGRQVTELRFGGGGANNEIWCQIKADILNRPVVITDCEEHGLLGAAITAWSALDERFSLSSAQERLVRIARRYTPRPERRQHYDQLFALFRQAEDAVRPLSHQLVRLQGREAIS